MQVWLHVNGQLNERSEWNSNGHNGLVERWDEDGVLVERAEYADGKKVRDLPLADEGDVRFRRVRGAEAERRVRDMLERDSDISLLPERHNRYADFETALKEPISTPKGALTLDADFLWDKLYERGREYLSGAIVPTLQQPDFIIEEGDVDLFVRVYKRPSDRRVYATVIRKERDGRVSVS